MNTLKESNNMSTSVLELKGVSKKAPNPDLGKIHSLNLRVHPGEILSLLGMKRWERQTMIDMVSAIDKPDNGTVFFQKKALTDTSESELNILRGRMGIVGDPPIFLNNVRIMENLRLPLRYHSKHGIKTIDSILLNILGDLGFRDFPDIIPSNFDHKFLASAALARALSTAPDLLILDRPLECFGEILAFRLPEICKTYVTDKGGAVLLLTTVQKLAVTVSNRWVFFEDGTIKDIKSKKVSGDKNLSKKNKDP